MLRFDRDGSSIECRDSRIECLDESEGLGLRIVADEELRSSFVGLDDLNAANAKISEEQRRTLDRIAAARFDFFFFLFLFKRLKFEFESS